MTLDEAIKHCEEKAKELSDKAYSEYGKSMTEEEAYDCNECAREHEQLAKWLKELKAYKESSKGDLISRDALKKCAIPCQIHNGALTDLCVPLYQIDNAPTVELDESVIQEVLNKRCMTAVANDYLVALHGKRPQGEWIPVSERLPEEKLFNPSGSDFGFDFEEVLCTTIWGNVRSYKFGKPIGHYKPHFWFGGEIMDEYVVAWQYKPEPYKKGGAE